MRKLVTPLALVALSACSEVDAVPHTPMLSEVSMDADAELSVVDRTAALEGAVETEASPVLELADDPAFRLRINGDAVADELDGAGAAEGEDDVPAEPETYAAIWTASLAVAAADLATVAVVGPPAAAIGIATDGEIVQIDDRLWSATNTVTGPEGVQVTADFNVAWVGVGWLAEMRITTSDGAYDDTLWFNGFVSHGGGLGWWDLYSGGEVVGVVEWIADGQGNHEAGIVALAGDVAGDVLVYLSLEGQDRVGYYDASLGFENYVHVYEDRSGEVALSNTNGGTPLCWAAETWADTACPAE